MLYVKLQYHAWRRIAGWHWELMIDASEVGKAMHLRLGRLAEANMVGWASR